MPPRSAFALGAGIGAWTVIATQLLAARYAGRHFLAIVQKEQQP